MKIHSAILFLIFYGIEIIAQDCSSIIDSVYQMNILYDYGFEEGLTGEVIISEDTLIDSKEYKKLLFPALPNHPDIYSEYYCNPVCYTYTHFDLFIRESEDNCKIFLMSEISKKENLIMDLTLEKNDTFKISNGLDETRVYIIDSIYTNNNRKHIVFINYNEFKWYGKKNLEFIEGIGPTWGLFYGFNHINNLLLCAYKDDSVKLYSDISSNDCYVQWHGDILDPPCPPFCLNIKNAQENDNLIIYANNQYILIKLPDYLNTNKALLYVIDSQGRIVKVLESNDGIFKILNGAMSNGIYIFKLISDKKIYTRKVVF